MPYRQTVWRVTRTTFLVSPKWFGDIAQHFGDDKTIFLLGLLMSSARNGEMDSDNSLNDFDLTNDEFKVEMEGKQLHT